MRKRILLFIFLSVISFKLTIKEALASTTLYFGSIEKTYDDSGTIVEEKVYYPAGNSLAVKSITGSTSTTGTTSYLFSDHLGSTVLVTDNEGNETASYLYYPYGEQSSTSTSLSTSNLAIQQFSNDKLYTGQRKDSSTDLYYYNARYYNPRIGRFISADKAEGPNRYAYVGNNPVMRNDPSGNNWIDNIDQWWNNVSASFDNNEIFGHYSETQVNTGKYYASKDYQNMVIGGYAAAGVLYGGGIAAATFAPEIIASGSLIGTTLAERVGAKSREIKEIIQAAKLPNIPKPDWGMAYARAAAAVEKTGIRIYEGDIEFTQSNLGTHDPLKGVIKILNTLNPRDKLAILHHEYAGHQIFQQVFETNPIKPFSTAEGMSANEVFAITQTANQSFNTVLALEATRRLAMVSQLGSDINAILQLFGYSMPK